jgi:CDP-6-deoxy-D-xylo-4-hexulose-3-dehydrase
MSIEQLIDQFISNLDGQEGVLPYLYNAKNKQFDPQKDWIFYSGPFWDFNEPRAAIKAFLTGKWLVAGENVARFEKEFSKKYNFEASLMVNSGSSANLVLISAAKKYFNWSDGDEIVVSPVGFPTTISPIVQNNLKPLFIDISMDHLNFDLDLIEKVVSVKTKAIFISPVLGNSPDMDKLLEICKKLNIVVLLDGCDSLGSKWDGKDLSDYAFATTCSFYPAHHITTGEGGMVSSKDKEFIALCRSFAWWGRDCYCVGAANLSMKGACGKRFDKWLEDCNEIVDHKYIFTSMGYNLKPLDLQGAIGLEQLQKIDDIHAKRRRIKNKLSGLLKKYFKDSIHIPEELPKAETSWFGVPIVCSSNTLKARLVDYLEKNRIQTRNYFAGNVLMHPAYKTLDNYKNYPESNKVLGQVFFIGCYPGLTDEMIQYIDTKLSEFKI